jgi:transcriptional regulator with XRE-family HTH domain
METVGERLKRVRKYFHFSAKEFMEITGYATKQVLSNMESGDRKVSADKGQILQDELGVNFSWLILGKGAMFIDEAKADEVLRKRGKLPPSVSPEKAALLKDIKELKVVVNKELDKLTDEIMNLEF